MANPNPRDVQLSKLEDRIDEVLGERDYLWTALAKLEAEFSITPREDIGRIARTRVAAALDGFRPKMPEARPVPK